LTAKTEASSATEVGKNLLLRWHKNPGIGSRLFYNLVRIAQTRHGAGWQIGWFEDSGIAPKEQHEQEHVI
jgi:hypothetical protein